MTPSHILKNTLRRSLLLATALLLAVTCATAKTRVALLAVADGAPTYYFVVWQRTGEKIAYMLSEHPSVKQRGDKIIVETTTAEIDFPLSSVCRFTLTDRLREGQVPRETYYDVNDDGHVTVVDVALLISRMGNSVTPYIINEATNAILRIKK